MEEKGEGPDPDKIWKNLREACTEIADEVQGRKNKNIRSQSKTVKDLSEAQKLYMEATNDKNKIEDPKRERNKIINTLHKEIQKEDRKKLNEKIKEIDKFKDDFNRIFQVIIRQLQRKERKKILVHTENGVTVSEKKQTEI